MKNKNQVPNPRALIPLCNVFFGKLNYHHQLTEPPKPKLTHKEKVQKRKRGRFYQEPFRKDLIAEHDFQSSHDGIIFVVIGDVFGRKYAVELADIVCDERYFQLLNMIKAQNEKEQAYFEKHNKPMKMKKDPFENVMFKLDTSSNKFVKNYVSPEGDKHYVEVENLKSFSSDLDKVSLDELRFVQEKMKQPQIRDDILAKDFQPNEYDFDLPSSNNSTPNIIA